MVSLVISVAAVIVSVVTLLFTIRERSINSYSRLIEDFNQLSAMALADEELLKIYHNLFYGQEEGEYASAKVR
ncbi:MAG: hypothetical protein AAGG51_00230 [Cyanobacteria bacterium P01_G01_bin.54]